MRSITVPKWTFIVCISALVASCGGGGTASPPIPAASVPDNGGTQPAYVRFQIVLPPPHAARNAKKRPLFQAPGETQSIGIVLTSVNGTAHSGTAQTFDISSSAPGCTAASGTITCDATVTGVAGTDAFTVTSYAQPDGKGIIIAKGTAQVAAIGGQTVPAPITLSGTVASVSLQITGIYVVGQATMVPVTVIAKDADGATIMGTYDRLIQLSDSDVSGITKLSTSEIGDSSTAADVALFYTGAPLASPVTISANVSGLSGAQIANATFTPNGDNAMVAGSTYTYDYSESIGVQYAGATPQPAFTASATEAETIVQNATFNGHSDLDDVHTTSTYTDGSTNTTDSYFGWSVSPVAAKLLWYGQSSASNSPATNVTSNYAYTYLGPATMDVVPHAAGNTWTSNDAYTDQSSSNQQLYDSTRRVFLPAKLQITETFNADGSYKSDLAWNANDGSYGFRNSITVNADGTASIYDFNSASGATVTAYGTPQPASGGNGMVIPVRTGSAPAPAPTPTLGPATLVPDWYPNGGALPNPMITDTFVDKGAVAVPSACNVPSGIPTTAEEIDETYWNFDPTGMVATSVTKTYEAANYGTVCASTQTEYDWYDAATTGALSETQTYSQLQTLTKATLLSALRQSGFTKAMETAGNMLMARARVDRLTGLEHALMRLRLKR
jgi:hypothetical protein